MTQFLPWFIFFIGAWCVVNGILHDIFVLRSEDGKKFDRNLLRLLFDGHILITCGVMLLLSFSGIKSGEHLAYYISIAACLSLFLYCCMIWKFLKSVVTMTISLAGIILLIFSFLQSQI
jgi:hypothetical protein